MYVTLSSKDFKCFKCRRRPAATAVGGGKREGCIASTNARLEVQGAECWEDNLVCHEGRKRESIESLLTDDDIALLKDKNADMLSSTMTALLDLCLLALPLPVVQLLAAASCGRWRRAPVPPRSTALRLRARRCRPLACL